MLANNQWIRSAGTLNEKPISIQYRQDWQLAKEAGEQTDILVFNEFLQSNVEAKENALVLMVISHSGINQWVVYARDLERFKQDLERIPTREGGYPIEVVADMDEDWQTFTQVYQAIEQPA